MHPTAFKYELLCRTEGQSSCTLSTNAVVGTSLFSNSILKSLISQRVHLGRAVRAERHLGSLTRRALASCNCMCFSCPRSTLVVPLLGRTRINACGRSWSNVIGLGRGFGDMYSCWNWKQDSVRNRGRQLGRGAKLHGLRCIFTSPAPLRFSANSRTVEVRG